MPLAAAALYNIDERLLVAVSRGNQREALNMLTAFGASVDGSSQQDYRPLSWAAVNDNVGMIKFLVGRGADLEAKTGALPSTAALQSTTAVGNAASNGNQGDSALNGKMEITMTAGKEGDTKGMGAVHVAIFYRKVDALRALLQLGADPNALDSGGATPLFCACGGRFNTPEDAPRRLAMVHELLNAGADPSIAAASGQLPLHRAAGNGDTGLVDLLLAKAPATLQSEDRGSTPLSLAVMRGHESAVLHLLSAGAIESQNRPGGGLLSVALLFKNENMMHLLLKKGLWAIGGAAVAIPPALSFAVTNMATERDMRFVRPLLEAEGADRVEHWARCYYNGWPMLHHAASTVAVGAVSALLQAGADETALGTTCGRTARECVAKAPEDYPLVFPPDAAEKEPAVHRMLARGPAYRARSWAWLAGHVASLAAANTAPFPSSKPAASVGVRIFRPTSAKFYVRFISRYTLKSSP